MKMPMEKGKMLAMKAKPGSLSNGDKVKLPNGSYGTVVSSEDGKVKVRLEDGAVKTYDVSDLPPSGDAARVEKGRKMMGK